MVSQLYINRSVLTSAASVFQMISSVITLYRTRGNQIEQFGYTAYGLSVIPYALMSLVNLLANMVTPDY